MKLFCFFGFVLLFGLTVARAQKADLIVAADGSGAVKTVGEAIKRVPENNKKRFVIRLKSGVYNEQINIPASKPFVSLIGESAENTKLTFKISNKEADSTSAANAFYVAGADFYAENLTFENSFGAGSQAVAALVEADRAVFKSCHFLGWQDTLYAKNGRQFYRNCRIEGAVDFIFGQAAAVFENCEIYSKGDGYIAAPMRFAADEPSGFVFYKSKLTGENTKEGVYLGRPWRDYGRTVYIETEMGAHIKPEGWHYWQPEREKTAYFAEYKSSGAGARVESRVKWAHRLNEAEAAAFLPENFLKGSDGWNPRAARFDSPPAAAPDFNVVGWNDVLKQPAFWYATDEAARIADQIVLYQKDNGGWEKNIEMAAMLTEREKVELAARKSGTNETTIDNGATWRQLRFLAKVNTASLAKPAPPNNFPSHKAAFENGLDYLFAAQYANGGFPQYFPLKKGYYSRITFNDNAMTGALELLRDVAAQKPDFAFVDAARRAKAAAAVERGIAAILKTQVVVNNQKTVWCAQHDETTFAPAPARKFEPASLSGKESAGIVEFLMSVENPSPEIVEAIESAIRWFEKSKISGVKIIEKPNPRVPQGFERVAVKDPDAPVLWARFYDIATNRPIFEGRDSVVHYDFNEIEPERRNGYNYYTDEPRELLIKKYPKWQQKQARNAEKNRK